jgi:hypothetical protein
MAYNLKYKITFASKSGVISYVHLLEDNYDDDVIEYDGLNISLQYIPKSDDIYEPIVVSQLSVGIDVTDNVADMPNFATLDDRKYLVQLYYGSTLEWQGWSLSDSVDISFSTGRKELAFNAIDGLGMLESIKYEMPSSYYLIQRKKALEVILECLDYIQFPTSLNLLSGISYFANGMANRATLGSNEPLNQTYVRYSTLLDNNLETINCLDLIRDFSKSFGCRFFQAEGMWFIVPLNEFAQDSYYYTIYNDAASIVSFGTRDQTLRIQGYSANTSGAYFVDNSQFKILKKGFNKVRIDKDIDYPDNYITNYDLKNYIGNVAAGWDAQFSGATSQIFIKPYVDAKLNSYLLYKENGTSSYAWVSPTNLPTVQYLDNFDVSFDIVQSGGSGIPTNVMYVKIMLDNGYFWNQDEEWSDNVSGSSYYYPIPYSPNLKGTQTVSCIRVPFTSSLTIQFFIGTIQGSESNDWVELNDFRISVTQRLTNVKIDSYFTDSNEYVYDLDLPYGFNSIVNGQYYYRGYLCDSSGNNLFNWYNQRYSSIIYRSLTELIINEYSNSLIKNPINVDSTFQGLNPIDVERFSSAIRIKMDDLDTTNSVENKPYIIGNSTIDLVNNDIACTLLELELNNDETTIDTKYTILTQGEPYPVKRSAPQASQSAANTASLTDNIVYILGNSTTSFTKAVAYTDQYCSVPFNGGNSWYKIQSENLVNFRVFYINTVGLCSVTGP